MDFIFQLLLARLWIKLYQRDPRPLDMAGPHIDPQLLFDIIETAADLNPGDRMSPRVLRAMADHLGALEVRRSIETGAGGSTLLFSQTDSTHTAFAIEGELKTITHVKASLYFEPRGLKSSKALRS